MAIRLLAFDLDGTTITEHQYLSNRNRDALIRAAEQGILLVPATGRMRGFIPEEIKSLPGVRYAVTSNGAAVCDLQSGETVYRNLISNDKAMEVQRLLDGYDTFIEYYRDGRAITRSGFQELAKTHFQFPKPKWHFLIKDYLLVDDFGRMIEETGICPEKINLPYLTEGLHREVWDNLESLGGLKLTSSIPDNIEINNGSANKGDGLQALCRILEVAPEEVMAVGDNGNDVAMLEYASCSVAVADGAPSALEAAKYKTGPHNEDGLAEAVERLLLSR